MITTDLTDMGGVRDFRRRLILERSYYRKWQDWITIRTRVYNSSTTANLCRAVSSDVNLFSRMIVGNTLEITPRAFYDFGDNAYHTVRQKLYGTTIKSYMYGTTNYTINYVYFPKWVTTIESTGFRGLGASQICYVIFDNTTPPTMLGSNTTGTTNIRIYVPDSAVQTYKSAQYWSGLASKIYPISEYPYTLYYLR